MSYADTSAIVKLVVEEKESSALEHWVTRSNERLVTSVITRIELQRAVLRKDPALLGKLTYVLSKLDLAGLTPAIVRQAAELQPYTLRTLDAIHLATMLTFGRESILLLSYDERLNYAAIGAGYDSVFPK